MNDPIADIIIRIKNSTLSGRKSVILPHSKQKESLAKILQKEGFLEGVEISANGVKKELILTLVGDGKRNNQIEVKRISKLGRRVYAKAKDLKILNRGLGIVILSTPKGLMTLKQAMKQNLGGEVLCKIS